MQSRPRPHPTLAAECPTNTVTPRHGADRAVTDIAQVAPRHPVAHAPPAPRRWHSSLIRRYRRRGTNPVSLRSTVSALTELGTSRRSATRDPAFGRPQLLAAAAIAWRVGESSVIASSSVRRRSAVERGIRHQPRGTGLDQLRRVGALMVPGGDRERNQYRRQAHDGQLGHRGPPRSAHRHVGCSQRDGHVVLRTNRLVTEGTVTQIGHDGCEAPSRDPDDVADRHDRSGPATSRGRSADGDR